MRTFDELKNDLRSAARIERAMCAEDGCDGGSGHADLLEETVAVIDMLRNDANLLRERLSHLLQSGTISSYDAKNAMTGKYLLDINELDERMRELCMIEEEYKEQEAQRAVERLKAYARADAPVYIASRDDILRRAAECVSGQREQDYGRPEDNFETIANLWYAYSGHVFSAVDVAMMMALLKIARISSGHGSEDSFVDLAGYAACGGEIFAKRQIEEG